MYDVFHGRSDGSLGGRESVGGRDQLMEGRRPSEVVVMGRGRVWVVGIS